MAVQEVQPAAFTAMCPQRIVLDHMMSRWGVLVLLVLARGTCRWGELKRSVDGISEKMLASTLRTLEGDGLVSRRSYPEVPPRVEYSLTDLGCDLMQHLQPLMDWIELHASAIVEGPPSDAGLGEPAAS